MTTVTTTTIRIDERTREKVRILACEMGVSMQEVVAQAVEAYRRQQFLKAANEAYAALRADPEAWKELLAERAEWDATLMDDLEDDAYPLEDH